MLRDNSSFKKHFKFAIIRHNVFRRDFYIQRTTDIGVAQLM